MHVQMTVACISNLFHFHTLSKSFIIDFSEHIATSTMSTRPQTRRSPTTHAAPPPPPPPPPTTKEREEDSETEDEEQEQQAMAAASRNTARTATSTSRLMSQVMNALRKTPLLLLLSQDFHLQHLKTATLQLQHHHSLPLHLRQLEPLFQVTKIEMLLLLICLTP